MRKVFPRITISFTEAFEPSSCIILNGQKGSQDGEHLHESAGDSSDFAVVVASCLVEQDPTKVVSVLAGDTLKPFSKSLSFA